MSTPCVSTDRYLGSKLPAVAPRRIAREGGANGSHPTSQRLLDRVQDGLAGRAFLYDSPQDYQSGVEDAIHALTHGAEIQFDGDRPARTRSSAR